MSRIDDVVEIVAPYLDDRHGEPEAKALHIARALDADGHLMPDLPSVKFDRYGIWGDCGVTVYRGQRTLELYAAMEYGDLPETLEPDEARHTAYALLAAADYAERNQE